MISRNLILSIVQFTVLVSSAVAAQTTEDQLTAEQLKSLVTGRTWAISLRGDLANPNSVTYWDFKVDGSICARFAGGKPKDKCADDGKWQLKGDVLCWELERIGDTYGYKSVCAGVRKVNEKRYELIAPIKVPPIAFYPYK